MSDWWRIALFRGTWQHIQQKQQQQQQGFLVTRGGVTLPAAASMSAYAICCLLGVLSRASFAGGCVLLRR
jgi:hypothetical protein